MTENSINHINYSEADIDFWIDRQTLRMTCRHELTEPDMKY